MGFDMHMVLPVKQVPDGYEPISDAMPEYYQLTFSGMFEVVAAMAAAGVLDEAMPTPSLPPWPPPNIAEDRAEKLQPVLFDPEQLRHCLLPDEVPLIDDFLKRWQAGTGQRSELAGKVPAFKFTSNAGWWVCPDECRLVAAALSEMVSTRPTELQRGLRERGFEPALADFAFLVVPWAVYNRVAADHGGYRVW